MTPLCGLCLDGAKPYPKGCPECGEKPRAKPVKLWLWRDGEGRFLAFDSLFPTMPGGGDPAVLGQPAGYAIFHPMTLAEAQAASREHKAEGARCETTEAKPSTTPSAPKSASRDDVLEEALERLLDDAITKKAWLNDPTETGHDGCGCAYCSARRALKEKPHG